MTERLFRNSSSEELRKLYLESDGDHLILFQLISELQYRPGEEVEFILKGIKRNSESHQAAELSQRSRVNSETTYAECPLKIGQDVDDDMVVVSLDSQKGTFNGRDKKGVIWTCEIADYVSTPISPRMVAEKMECSNSGELPVQSVEPQAEELPPNNLYQDYSELLESKTTTLATTCNANLFDEEQTLISSIELGSIRAPGNIKGVPEKRLFELKKDIKLDISADTPLVKKYEIALKALIQEFRQRKLGFRQIMLEDGVQIALDGREIGYQFPYDGEAELFEGARVIASVGSSHTEGKIVAVLERQLIVTFKDDFGENLSKVIIRVDNTAMIEALREKLEGISNGDQSDFNLQLAEAVINNHGEEMAEATIESDALSVLNLRQAEAVKKVLTNEVLYLWGPPGTGKTQTMSILNQILYDSGKRILLCSNTNQAVDQVLLKLCDKLKVSSAALEEGQIIRVGRISHQELADKWSDYITINGIVDRKSVLLKQRKDFLDQELEKINSSIMGDLEVLRQFKHLDELVKAEEDNRKLLRELQTKIKVLSDQRSKLIHTEQKIEKEIQEYSASNKITRLFKRSKDVIDQELLRTKQAIDEVSNQIKVHSPPISDIEEKLSGIAESILDKKSVLDAFNRKYTEKQVEAAEKKKQPIISEISDVNKQLEDIAKSVLDNARIIGATVTKAYLSPQLFKGFDIVVIDEASMVMLPALFYVAGLAKEKVVISGDPCQLSAIVQTEQKAIFDVIGGDVFPKGNLRKRPKRVVMLEEQYRMKDPICKLISSRMYNGKLRTGKQGVNKSPLPPSPFNETLTIIDTSPIWPFVNRDPFNSRYNLMNALAIRNLALYFSKNGYITKTSQVGVCTPYSAQSKVLQRMFQSSNLEMVEAGTVHRYQGDEKDLMIIDIPDSYGEHGVSVFLEADNPFDTGSKLFNVAVSRAKSHLVVMANLSYLDKKLPKHAFLRGVLADMANRGKVIDVRKVLSLYPIFNELKKYNYKFELSEETLSNGLFNQKDFHEVCLADISRARKGVAIFSAFITPQRVSTYEGLIRTKLNEGVVIRCITRPPDKNGSISVEDGTLALDVLGKWGCIVDTRADLHEKAVIIDDEIVWFGSLNPLSHTFKTNEMMARIESVGIALQVATFLAIDKGIKKDSAQGLSLGAENPRCPECNSRSSYRKGKYGPYWKCEKCKWTENVGNTKRGESETKLDRNQSPPCPECGAGTIPRAGRYGEFYGCSQFPRCNGKVKVNKVKKLQK